MSEKPAVTDDQYLGNHSGISAAAKYNPHLWSPDELRSIFVARQRELQTILAALRTASPAAAPQHLLITGQIEKTALSGTKRYGYQASERFFNIWYLMRNSPRVARARVGWLVEFMRLWYSKDELMGIARTRWNEHRGGLHGDGAELEYSRAIVRAMPEDAQDRRLLDWAVFQQARIGASFSELFELQGEDADYSTSHNYLERLEVLREALKLASSIPEADKPVWIQRVSGALHLTLAEKEALARDCANASMARLAEIQQELAERREQIIARHERLKRDGSGDVVLQLKSPWRDGTTHIKMSSLEFMQRLVALVPRPRLHLTRFHGVLAPNAGLRAAIVPGPPQNTGEPADKHAHGAPARMGWARLLRRVFDLDLAHCPQCGGAFKIIAAIEEPAVIVGVLTHLGLPARAPPRIPARPMALFQAA